MKPSAPDPKAAFLAALGREYPGALLPGRGPDEAFTWEALTWSTFTAPVRRRDRRRTVLTALTAVGILTHGVVVAHLAITHTHPDGGNPPFPFKDSLRYYENLTDARKLLLEELGRLGITVDVPGYDSRRWDAFQGAGDPCDLLEQWLTAYNDRFPVAAKS